MSPVTIARQPHGALKLIKQRRTRRVKGASMQKPNEIKIAFAFCLISVANCC
jgi:hypothetical protein